MPTRSSNAHHNHSQPTSTYSQFLLAGRVASPRHTASITAAMTPGNSFHQPLCANCQKPGGSACASCRLVTYCSKACQTTHWKTHKYDCKSPLRDRTWLPPWLVEGRKPVLHGEGGKEIVFNRKYLFGNMPALDVVCLERNEGRGYRGDLKLLFAASGDFRNVVKTLASLPQTYNGNVLLAINDLDIDVVARNVIMLLLALKTEDPEQAIQSIIHIWYSATIRPVDAGLLTESIYPMIEDVCVKIADRAAGSLQAKTWTVGKCSLRLVLKKEAWKTLLSHLHLPPGLTLKQAYDKRVAVTKAEQKQEIHRDFCVLHTEHRVCRQKYREDGIMLPFGHSREEFTVPNPTLHQSTVWPMNELADPTMGWSFTELLNTDAGPAIHDIYGKLYAHVHSVLSKFQKRLSETGARFELHNIDLVDLQDVYAPATFDRIETTNICDSYYLGTYRTLWALSPLLQKRSANPCATLLALYMTAVNETRHSGDWIATRRLEEKALEPYFPLVKERCPHTELLRFILAGVTAFVRDADSFFDEFARLRHFHDQGRINHLRVKQTHTVTEKWPTRVKTSPGQEGWEDDFVTALGSMASPNSRYVEWARSE